jgi:hypothetical protein
VWLGGALGLVLALSGGCGNGEALSKDEYVARLNAMCEEFSAREERIGEPQNVSDLVEKGPRVLEAFEEAIVDEVDGLEAPDEIAEQANRLVEVAKDQRDVLRDLIEAAKDNDLAAVRTLSSRNEVLNDEASSIMRELGADACA